jgi:hypothetical protein
MIMSIHKKSEEKPPGNVLSKENLKEGPIGGKLLRRGVLESVL